MRFKPGMLGVAILTVAIAATIMGSWVLSLDVENKEVTRYNALADITPLFGSEEAPEFTDYNPVRNYTGYFKKYQADDSIPYFDGVDYMPSSMPNMYKLNIKPTMLVTSATYDLSQLSAYDSDYRRVIYYDYDDNDDWYTKLNDDYDGDHGGKTVTLASLIAALDIGHDYDRFKLYSTANLNAFTAVRGQDQSVNWCVFSTISEWNHRTGTYVDDYWLALASPEFLADPYADWENKYSFVSPKLSAIVDLTLNSVELYYDNDFKKPAGISTLDNVLISIEGGNGSAYTGGLLTFGKVINYDAMRQSDPVYMDPSGGVSLEQ